MIVVVVGWYWQVVVATVAFGLGINKVGREMIRNYSLLTHPLHVPNPRANHRFSSSRH